MINTSLQTGTVTSGDEGEREQRSHNDALDVFWKVLSELAHRHEQRLLVHKEKRWWRQMNKCSRETSGWHRDFEFTFMVKHGLGLSTRPLKRWKLSHQTLPSMMLSAPFTALSGSADHLFIKDELPDHTAETAEDIILSDAASLDETLAEDR